MMKISVQSAIVLVTVTAFNCGISPLAAQDDATQAQPESVFIPQADPAPAKPPAASGRSTPSRSHAPRPGGKAGAGSSGGAASAETFGSWTLNCGTDNGRKFCTVIQAQVNKDTGQRTFAIEMGTAKNGTTEGTILMPFGLKLDSGVMLRLDDKDVAHGLHFSTCLAQGCLVPIAFPSASIDAIRRAKTLNVMALSINNDQAVTFSVVLDGLAAAIDRAAQLMS